MSSTGIHENPARTEHGALGPKRPSVLLVDDDSQLLAAIHANLRKRYSMELETVPRRALERLRQNPDFDVIVSDMLMPGMRGSDFLAAARELAPASQRVILSGQDDLETAIQAVNEGAVFRFVQKPCMSSELASVIDAAIEHRQLVDLAFRARELETIDRVKSALLATLSHELRTPLTKIQSASSILESDDGELAGEMREECVRTIAEESTQLGRRLVSVLELVDIESGLDEERCSDCDGVALVRDIVTARRSGSTRVFAKAAGRQLHVDRRLIERALDSVLDNAERYGGDRGTEVVIESDERSLWIAVGDRGPGLPANAHELVFDCFYQTQEHLTAKPNGLGMGLAVARAIVRAHGGELSYRDRDGGGAIFEFRLPLAD